MVELRGLEPRTDPAEMAADLRWMFVHVVPPPLSVLLICVAVLSDVTSLAVHSSTAITDSTPFRTRNGNAFDCRPQQLSFGVGTADMPAATQGVATINGFTFTRIQANWFNPSIAHQYSCSSEAISRLAQQTCAQYVPNGIPLLFAGGGGGCHPLGLGLIEIGAHFPHMAQIARIARSRLARILDPLGPLLAQPHEQRHAGRHAVQFGVVPVAALELFA